MPSTAGMFNLRSPSPSASKPPPHARTPSQSPAPRTISQVPAPRGSTSGMFDLKNIPVNDAPTQEQATQQLQAIAGKAITAAKTARRSSSSPSARHALASPRESKQQSSQDLLTHEIAKIPVANQKISHEEILKLLDGYVVLPRARWDTDLVYRQHIRYVRAKDNVFVRGGFIVGFGKQRGKATLTIANGFDTTKQGYYSWVIGLGAISAIFVKRESLHGPPERAKK